MPCLICRVFSRRASSAMIDADGFIRYQHLGEGTYEENKEEIQDLRAERNEILAIRL